MSLKAWSFWNQFHLAWPMPAATGISIVPLMIVAKIDTKELMVILQGQSGRGRPSWRRRTRIIAAKEIKLVSIAQSSHVHQSVAKRRPRLSDRRSAKNPFIGKFRWWSSSKLYLTCCWRSLTRSCWSSSTAGSSRSGSESLSTWFGQKSCNRTCW